MNHLPICCSNAFGGSLIEIGIAIGIGIEMVLGHEKLDVYRLSIGYVAWVYERCARLGGVHRSARDQWLRASQSIALNIAEGNGKTAKVDRRRYFEIARGSALECAAIQDVLVVGKGLEKAESRQRKDELDSIAVMHTTYLKIMIWSSGMGLGR